MYVRTNTQKGFVALITAIIVAVSLLTLVIAVGFEGFQSRFTVFESDFKEKSIYLAEACVNTAILKLSQDTSYDGGEFVPVGDNQCEIVEVTDVSGNEVIKTTATSNDAYTHLQVTVNASAAPDITIIEWKEVKDHS